MMSARSNDESCSDDSEDRVSPHASVQDLPQPFYWWHSLVFRDCVGLIEPSHSPFPPEVVLLDSSLKNTPRQSDLLPDFLAYRFLAISTFGHRGACGSDRGVVMPHQSAKSFFENRESEKEDPRGSRERDGHE